ncbi:MAG: hypothetical protein V4450_17580 [Bacteroidota bacterium]
MKKISILFIVIIFAGIQANLFGQCPISNPGEEQHGSTIDPLGDLSIGAPDFSNASIDVIYSASNDPTILAGQISAFLNSGNPNGSDYTYQVDVINGNIWIGNMATQKWFTVSPDVARVALNYYDPNRSTFVVNGVIYPMVVPDLGKCDGTDIPIYNAWADVTNPFMDMDQHRGGGGVTSVNTSISPLTPCPTDANIQISTAMIAAVYPSVNRAKADLVSEYINRYKSIYNISGRKELAYFLGQVLVETDGFRVLKEEYNYSRKNIKDNFKNRIPESEIDNYVNCICLFDRVYCCRNENGPESSHDGSKFLGQGIIQLTFKESYRKFTEFYHAHGGDPNLNFVTNPELLADDLRIGTLAALWEFGIDKRKSTLYERNIGMAMASDDINRVSLIINAGGLKMGERYAATNAFRNLFCL